MTTYRTILRSGRSILLLASVLFLTYAALTPAGPALAADPLVAFDSDTQRARYDRMLEEYRCLKCQNQNLADSNAALAGDLRREIRVRILEGLSDEGIDNYLVSRYGDFVRYKPRFSGITLALWVTPFALLAIGLATAFLVSRRSTAQAAPTQASEKIDEARQLLASDHDPNSRSTH